jgi:glycosyltransferase involved in cell wall biosynthesis
MSGVPDLVSIVIPCRNAAEWIRETLESASCQPDVNTEIILVDDGSEDDSVEAAKAAAGSSLRVIRQQHAGVSRARNMGTDAARGAFIQYLDADDVLMPGVLSGRVAALGRSGADVAYSNWVWWQRQRDGGFAEGATVARRLGRRPDVDLLTEAWWPPGALLYRRTIVDRIGPWREDLPIIQDSRFQLDAALSGGTFVHVDAIGLKYRVHSNESLSRRDPGAFLDDCFRSVSELQAAWERQSAVDEERRRALVKVYAFLSRGFFRADRSRFNDMLRRLRALEPNFLPEGPRALRALSRLFGYPAAEHVAACWRVTKAACDPAARGVLRRTAGAAPTERRPRTGTVVE